MSNAEVSYDWGDGWTGIESVSDMGLAVSEIARRSRDNEVAHSMEDELYRFALKQIAEGRPADPSAFAAAALRAADLDFTRWFA